MDKEQAKALLSARKFSPLGSKRAAMAAEEFLAELKRFYLFYFEEAFVEERLEVPADWLDLLEVLEGCWMEGANWAFLADKRASLSLTDEFYELYSSDFFERKQEKAPILNDTLWLKIGYWSDKHDWIVCLDKQHPWFGKAIDAYDDHPLWTENFCDDGVYAGAENFLRDKYER